MSEIKSPQFSRNIPQSAQRPMREFNVGVSEEELDQMNVNPYAQAQPQPQTQPPAPVENLESKVHQARKEKSDLIKYGPRITDFAKRRIEILSNIGRLTRDVQIGESVFSLRTLKEHEQRAATLASVENAKLDLQIHFEGRKQQLSRALYKIDGEDIAIVLGTDDPEARLELLGALEDIVVEKLWTELVSLKDEVRTKYGIKSAKDAEEVAADLKK